MNLLNDQSKVIGNLQKTIEGLNITIKNLNDKIEKMEKMEKMEAPNEVSNDKIVEVEVDVDMISINVTTSSKNDHPEPVQENSESSKCLGKSKGNSDGKVVHENVKP